MATFFGPEVARNMVQRVPYYLYKSCFFWVFAMQFISLLVLTGMVIPKPNRTRAGGRPSGVFFLNPVFVVGMTC